jgi:hypothetical protein
METVYPTPVAMLMRLCSRTNMPQVRKSSTPAPLRRQRDNDRIAVSAAGRRVTYPAASSVLTAFSSVLAWLLIPWIASRQALLVLVHALCAWEISGTIACAALLRLDRFAYPLADVGTELNALATECWNADAPDDMVLRSAWSCVVEPVPPLLPIWMTSSPTARVCSDNRSHVEWQQEGQTLAKLPDPLEFPVDADEDDEVDEDDVLDPHAATVSNPAIAAPSSPILTISVPPHER